MEVKMKTGTTKSTILIISMGFLTLFLLFQWQLALFLSLLVGITGIISSYLSERIEWVWMKLAQLLAYIMPNLLLSIVFFFLLFPISLLSKLFTKDPLMLSNKHNSYFIEVKENVNKDNFEKVW
jgi:hypothetical protein